ncbi:MAG: DNA mismatch repair endonuclease MutL, partial [Oscillospiraceae bacterium]|nr:DNA mismatch repair endonuclease MutL [Oscillospiraceae bacterium]
MPVIKQLDPHVADLIAAGEVVERPASVVKELMENAIDAGAGAVTVEITHGGMSLIRVTDDGCGIPADQAATAFLRHATSKIATEYDLEAIGTLGFRGEALAAISAVSRVELLTRTDDADLGASLTVEAGVVVSQEEAGCPRGTTLAVRDLFFNTPARLKFMKKDAAEGAAVFAVVQRVALSHPELSVKFIRDGKQELLTPGDGQLKSAVYAVMGRDIALGFLPIKGSGEGMSAEGFASLPTCCRGSRSYQHFFVNGRYVKSRIMMVAVEEAYKNQKMVGKFPGCVVHLTVRPGEVDVNVHPTKTEVKFQREQQVFSTVYYAVLSALDRDHTRPQAVMPGVKPQDTVTPNQASLPLNDGAKGLVGTQFMPASRFKPVPGFGPSAKPAQSISPAPKAAEQKPAPSSAPERKKSPFQWVEPLPDTAQPTREPPVPKQNPEPVHTGLE